MKKKDLFALQMALMSVGSLVGPKFAYAIAKNKVMVDKEVRALQEANKPVNEKITEYRNTIEKKRIEMCEKFAVKDENGKAKKEVNPMTNRKEYVIEDYVALDEAMKKLIAGLEKEYKDDLELQKKQDDKYEKMLEEDIKIEFHKIKEEDLPENITPNQLSGIMELME